MNIMKRIVLCWILGKHDKTPMIIEDSFGIYEHGCARCGCPIGFPSLIWSTYNCPPPALPGEYQMEETRRWHEFLNDKVEKLRNKKKHNHLKNR